MALFKTIVGKNFKFYDAVNFLKNSYKKTSLGPSFERIFINNIIWIQYFKRNIFINCAKAIDIHKLTTPDFHSEPLDSLLVMVTHTLFEEKPYM